MQKFLLERGDKPEKGGVNVEMGGAGGGGGGGGCATVFTTLQFSSIVFTFSVLQSFELAMQDFHHCSHPSFVLKPGISRTFLVHFGSLQKMLTALFNLVPNTFKRKNFGGTKSWFFFFLNINLSKILSCRKLYPAEIFRK